MQVSVVFCLYRVQAVELSYHAQFIERERHSLLECISHFIAHRKVLSTDLEVVDLSDDKC